MFRRAFVLLAGTIALAGCGGGGFGQFIPGQAPSFAPPTSAGPGGVGPVAILAPLTGANAERGPALVQAAQLALAAPGSPPLDVRDTGSTPAGAAAAAQAAIAAGDRLILGPLTAAETAAVAGPAGGAGIPVLAFTNDRGQARPGVWPLGITPAQQVGRLVGAATGEGKSHFAALLPPGEFGAAMAAALTQALADAGAAPPDIRIDDGSNAGIERSVRDLSGYADRRGPIDAKIREARDKHTPEGKREAADLAKSPIPPPPFDALLLADTGEKLAWATSFLGYYDVGRPEVRLLGPALWANPAARGGAALAGAWYAAPDPAARTGFDADYTAKYGSPAPGVADVAFDAAAIARVLATSGGFSVASLCRPDGFSGVDGVFALQPDGRVRRGLAVFEIHRGGATMVEPAPTALAAPAI